MHALEKLWNLATGLRRENVDHTILRQRMEDAIVKLGIYEEFDWVEMIPDVNGALRRGETFWDYWDEDAADSWVKPPPIPDFTQPPAEHIDQETGEILDEEPDLRPKKKTKATEQVDMFKLLILKFMSAVPNRWVSAKEMHQLFPNEFSEKTMKNYLDRLHKDGQVERKPQYQRIAPGKQTMRHLYKFFPTTAVK
jgi:hypothetical protein